MYRLFQAFVYVLIGLTFANLLHVTLNLLASVRIAIVAITPVLVLDTILGIVKVHIPAWSLLCFLIAMGYVFFGIKANATAPPPAQTLGPQVGQE